MLKILQASLQQYMNRELPDIQAGFRKGRGTRDQTANICWIIEKARKFKIHQIHFWFIDYAVVFDSVTHKKLWKILKQMDYQTTLSTWETCMHVKKQQLEPDVEQGIGSKLGKEYIKAVYCYLAYLTYMQSTLSKTLDWMKHTLESSLQGKTSITSDIQKTPPL